MALPDVLEPGPLKLHQGAGGALRCNKRKVKQEILQKLTQFNIYKSKLYKYKHD